MTTAQEKLVEKALKQLSREFDGVMIIVRCPDCGGAHLGTYGGYETLIDLHDEAGEYLAQHPQANVGLN